MSFPPISGPQRFPIGVIQTTEKIIIFIAYFRSSNILESFTIEKRRRIDLSRIFDEIYCIKRSLQKRLVARSANVEVEHSNILLTFSVPSTTGINVLGFFSLIYHKKKIPKIRKIHALQQVFEHYGHKLELFVCANC